MPTTNLYACDAFFSFLLRKMFDYKMPSRRNLFCFIMIHDFDFPVLWFYKIFHVVQWFDQHFWKLTDSNFHRGRRWNKRKLCVHCICTRYESIIGHSMSWRMWLFAMLHIYAYTLVDTGEHRLLPICSLVRSSRKWEERNYVDRPFCAVCVRAYAIKWDSPQSEVDRMKDSARKT